MTPLSPRIKRRWEGSRRLFEKLIILNILNLLRREEGNCKLRLVRSLKEGDSLLFSQRGFCGGGDGRTLWMKFLSPTEFGSSSLSGRSKGRIFFLPFFPGDGGQLPLFFSSFVVGGGWFCVPRSPAARNGMTESFSEGHSLFSEVKKTQKKPEEFVF